jgi:aldehyde dehydrogenase (NAD+)
MPGHELILPGGHGSHAVTSGSRIGGGDRALERVRAIVVGSGLEDGVTMGPLARAAQLEKYHSYLGVARAEGDVTETPAPGREPAGGYFVRPAVVTGIRPEHRLAQEEVFAPIPAFLTVSAYDEAIEVVNGTAYGLSAGVVTSSVGMALRFTRDAEAGLVKVNQPTTWMAMNAPFGGMRKSSTQTFKEQGGDSAMQFYMREKTVYFDPEGAA